MSLDDDCHEEPAILEYGRTSLAGSRQSVEFRAFFDKEFRRVAGLCAKLLPDASDAEDIAQEAFERTFRTWGTVEFPVAYVMKTAERLVWARTRRDRRRGREHARVDWARDHPVENPDRATWDLVNRLPRGLREPTILHYGADLPLDEVGRVLHLKVGTVKSRLSKARSELKRLAGPDLR